jgi:hypothetical protein
MRAGHRLPTAGGGRASAGGEWSYQFLGSDENVSRHFRVALALLTPRAMSKRWWIAAVLVWASCGGDVTGEGSGLDADAHAGDAVAADGGTTGGADGDVEGGDHGGVPGSGAVVLGLHDGAINFCDNFEKWTDKDGNLIFGQPGYPDYPATAGEMGNAAWWEPLHVGTVRVSVPWDIALPWSPDAPLVTAHDPAGTDWAEYHLTALKNEQTCFDWWLNAAYEAPAVVNIAFKPDYDYRDPASNHILVPDIDTYRKAVAAFVAQYVDCEHGGGDDWCVPASAQGGGPGPARVARVHIITPWGEPDYANSHYPLGTRDTSKGCTAGCQGNALPAAGISRAKEVFFLPHGSSGMDPDRNRFDSPSCADTRTNYCGPVMAAQMWMAIYHACPGCVLSSGPTAGAAGSGIVAGDFSGGAGLNGGTVAGVSQSYLRTYAQHLDDCNGCPGVRPPTWGVHTYPDASNEEWCLMKTGRDFDPAAAGGSRSQSERFLNAMHDVGYHEHTYVWLDEVSVFATDNYFHASTTPPIATNGASCGINTSGQKPVYSPEVQARSFLWLFRTLPKIRGTVAPGRQPVINRIYYFRSFNGADPNGDNITPTNPTPNQQALYDAMVNR